MTSVRVVAVCLALITACGASSRSAQRTRTSSRGLEAAALPYRVLDARTGREIAVTAFWDRLAAARAVCVGEDHKNPHHHWVQLEVVRRLVPRWPRSALGMEMFQRPFQGVLDDFAAGRIDDATLRSRAGWAERWGYDYGFYGSTIDAAKSGRAALLALGTAKELTKQVSRAGIESLDAAERTQVPQLKLDDAAHRSWFDERMAEMANSAEPNNPHKPGADGSPDMPSIDRLYAVQVLWDETMADAAATWLRANAGGHLVILAGTGHCHDSAIIRRMQRRGVSSVVSVRSVIDDGEGGVSDALVTPVNDFLVVLEPPR